MKTDSLPIVDSEAAGSTGARSDHTFTVHHNSELSQHLAGMAREYLVAQLQNGQNPPPPAGYWTQPPQNQHSDYQLPSADKVVHVSLSSGETTFHLPANTTFDTIRIVGHDLVLVQKDGTAIVLEDAADKIPNIEVGDVDIPKVALEAAFTANGIQAAEGPSGASAPSSGGDFAGETPSSIGNNFGVTSLLGAEGFSFTPNNVTIPPPPLPQIAVNSNAEPTLTVSESNLTAATNGGVPGSDPDLALTSVSANFSVDFTAKPDVNGGTVTYSLSIQGGNGAASGLVDSQTGQADVLVQNGNTIEGHVGSATGALAFTISVNPSTGVVTFTEDRAVIQPQTSNSNPSENVVSISAGVVTLTATIIDGLGHQAAASIDLGKQISITDDGPHDVANAATVAGLTLSESDLTAGTNGVDGTTPNLSLTTTTGHFSGDFTDVSGADGLRSTTYALSINGGNGTASGFVDSQTGQADVLVQNGNTIEGHVGSATGALAFTITLNPSTGDVTFTEDRAIDNNGTGSTGLSLSAGLVTLTQTIVDNDGTSASASIDLGAKLSITDDTPVIKVSNSIISESVSESNLPSNAGDNYTPGTSPGTSDPSATEHLGKVFSDNFGADGQAKTDAVSYALSVGSNGSVTGLTDTLSGTAVTLVQNGTTEIDGKDGNGDVVFTLTLNPSTGDVTFTLDRSIENNSGPATLPFNAVTLTQTITDGDGSTTSAHYDLSKSFEITDDTPTIAVSTALPNAESVSESNLPANAGDDNTAGTSPGTSDPSMTESFAKLFTDNFGADGQAGNNALTSGVAPVSYALSIGTHGTSTGLIDTLSGDAITLKQVSATEVDGVINAGQPNQMTVFSYTVDGAGNVTFTLDRSVENNSGPVTLPAHAVELTQTITDGDGSTATSKPVDISQQFSIADDTPTIAVSTTLPTAESVSESNLPSNAGDNYTPGTSPGASDPFVTESFGKVFTDNFGADGQAGNNALTLGVAPVSYALSIGTHGTSTGLIDTLSGDAITLKQVSATEVDGVINAGQPNQTTVFSYTVDGAGNVTFTLDRSVENNSGPVTLPAHAVELTQTITDGDGSSTTSKPVDISQQFSITDDTPVITLTGATEPALSLSESHLTFWTNGVDGTDPDSKLTHISGDFSGAFSDNFGADGQAKSGAVAYSLSFSGTNSGLVDTQTGDTVLMKAVGTNEIDGYIDVTIKTPFGSTTIEVPVFKISVDSSGEVTFTELRSVEETQTNPTNASQNVVSFAQNLITLTQTITDGDGSTASKGIDLGPQLSITDDGPKIALTGYEPTMTLSESHLPNGTHPDANDTSETVNFGTGFFGLGAVFSDNFGADGPAKNGAVSYSLSIGNNGDSGLKDTQSNQEIMLVKNAATGEVDGVINEGQPNQTTVFSITVDAYGNVTFTLDRAIENNGSGPDGKSLAAGALTLTQTLTDGDGSTASKGIDLGSQLSIADDTPTIKLTHTLPTIETVSESHLPNGTSPLQGGADPSVSENFSGSFSDKFGADGQAGNNTLTSGVAPVSYALSIGSHGTSTGLTDTLSGDAVTLKQVSATEVDGVINAGQPNQTTVFSYTVDGAGNVTFTLDRSVENNSGPVTLPAHAVELTQTITDGDGSTATSKPVDISQQFSIADDTPIITVSTTSPTAESVSESNLPSNAGDNYTPGTSPGTSDPSATESFGKVFQDNFGADGQAGNNALTSGVAPVSYALSIGTHGASTGLTDTLSGDAITLKQVSATEVDGVINAGQTNQMTVFSYTVDGSGNVTFTLDRSVENNSGPATLPANAVTLTQTITDGDGSATSANVDVSKQFSITDDTPIAHAASLSVVDDGSASVTASNGGLFAATGTGGAGDLAGADGLAKISIPVADTTYSVTAASPTVTIQGQHGTLTLNFDGSYSYQANPNTKIGASDTFVYTLTDGDGSTSTQHLVVTIGAGAPAIGGQSASETVYESGLPTGTHAGQAADPVVSQTSVQFTAGADNVGVGLSTSGLTTSIAGLTWTPVTGTNGLVTEIDGYQDGKKIVSFVLSGTTAITDGHTGTVTVTETLFNPIDGNNGGGAGDLGTLNVVGNDAVNPSQSATDTISVGVVDDVPVISAVEDIIVSDIAPSSGQGTWTRNYGADGQNSSAPVGLTIPTSTQPDGETYKVTDLGQIGGHDVSEVQVSGNASFTFFEYTVQTATGTEMFAFADQAGQDPFFTLDVLANGTYTFNLESASLPTSATANFGGLFGANNYLDFVNGSATFHTFSQNNFDLQISAFGFGPAFGLGTFVDVSNGDLGVGTEVFGPSNQVNPFEGLDLKFGEAQSAVTLGVTPNFETVTITISDSHGDSSSETITVGPGQSSIIIDAAHWHGIGSGNAWFSGFNEVDIANADGTGFSLTSVGYTSQNSSIGGATLDFGLTAKDGDGSTSASSPLAVTLKDPPVANPDTANDKSGHTLMGGNVITGVGDTAPSAGADTQSGGEKLTVIGIGASGQSSQTVSDLGTTITTALGMLTMFADGHYTYTANPNESGTDTFNYTITDTDGLTSTTTLTINVNEVQPTAPAVTGTVYEAGLPSGSGQGLTTITQSGALNFSETGDAVTVTSVNGQNVAQTVASTTIAGLHGTLTINENGTYSYTLTSPENNNPTPDVFTYTVTDSHGNTSTNTLTFNIVDDKPLANADTASDSSGQTISADAAHGLFSASNSGGADKIGADGPSAAGSVVGVEAGNHPTAVVTTGIGTQIVGAYGTLTLNQDGSYSYKANPDTTGLTGTKTDTFTYTLKDGDGSTATSTLAIKVTEVQPTAPAVTGTVYEAGLSNGSQQSPTTTMLQGTIFPPGTGTGDTVTTIVLNGVTTAIPQDGTNLVLDTGPSGSEHGILTINDTGAYTYQLIGPEAPTGGVLPPDVFTYTVQDAQGNTNTGTLTVTIVDDKPVVTLALGNLPTAQSVSESNLPSDAGDNYTPGTSPGASDPFVTEGFSKVFSHSFGADGQAKTGAVSYTLSIGSHGVNTGLIDTLSRDAITLKQISPTEVDGVINAGHLNQTTVFSYTVDSLGNVTFTLDRSIENNSSSPIPANSVTLTQTITDGDGGTGSNSVDISQQFSIIDDKPLANPDTASVTSGQTVSADAAHGLFSASNTGGADKMGADGPSASGSVVGVEAGNHPTDVIPAGVGVGVAIAGLYGTLILNQDGSYSYKANPDTTNLTGPETDYFTYTLKDGDGSTATSTLAINVNEVQPAAPALTGTVYEAGLVPGPGVTVTGSGQGPTTVELQGSILPPGTGDTVTSFVWNGMTFSIPSGGFALGTGHGELKIYQDGSYTYELKGTETPVGGVLPPDVFTYTVQDAQGNTNTGTLTVTIVDDKPYIESVSNAQASDFINGVATETWQPIFGADGQGSTPVTLAPEPTLTDTHTQVTINSHSYELYQVVDGSTTYYEATVATGTGSTIYAFSDAQGQDPFFQLQVPASGGNYTFTLDSTTSTSGTNINLEQVPNAAYLYLASNGTLSGTANKPSSAGFWMQGFDNGFTGNGYTPTGQGTLKSSAQGLGVDNNNLGYGETVAFHFGSAQNDIQIGVGKSNGNGSLEEFQVTIYNASGTQHATEIITAADGAPIKIDAADWQGTLPSWFSTSGITEVDVTNLGTGNGKNGNGADDSVTLTSVDYATTPTSNSGETLNFAVSITDGDGSASATKDFSVTTPGGTAPTITASGSDLAYESGLPNGSNPTNPAQPSTVSTASVVVTPGSDPNVNVTLAAGGLTQSAGITWVTSANGQEIDGYQTQNGQSVEVLSLALVAGAAGHYTIQETIDHALDNNGASTSGDLGNLYVVATDPNDPALTNYTSVSIGVVDDKPLANPDTASVTSGQTVSATAAQGLFSASNTGGADKIGADGPSASGSVVGVEAGNNPTDVVSTGVGTQISGLYGTLTLNQDGSYSYQANPDTSGLTGIKTDTFTYTLKDGDGSTATSTLAINVNEVHPTANAVTGTVYEAGLANGSGQGPTTTTQSGTLSFSETGDTVTLTSIVGAGSPVAINQTSGAETQILGTHGTLTITDTAGVFSYAYVLNSAESNNPAPDTFTYTVTDSHGNTTTSTLTFGITDDKPLANPDTASVSAGQTVAVDAAHGLFSASNTGGADLMGADGPASGNVTGVTSAANNSVGTAGTAGADGIPYIVQGADGTLTLNQDGSFSYVANSNATPGAIDTFNYTITDADGSTATNTLTFTIAAAPFLVYESGLSTGSDPGGTPTTATTTVSFTAGSHSETVALDGSHLTAPSGYFWFPISGGGLGLYAYGSFTPVLTLTFAESSGFSSGSIPAHSTGTVTITETLYGPIIGNNGSGAGDLGTLNVVATDTSNHKTTDSVSVGVVDDAPVFQSADHGVIANSSTANDLVGHLTYNAGADGLASLNFVNPVDDSQLATSQSHPTSTSLSWNGSTLFEYVDNSGTLHGEISTGKNNFEEVFTVSLSGSTYDFNLEQPLSNGANPVVLPFAFSISDNDGSTAVGAFDVTVTGTTSTNEVTGATNEFTLTDVSGALGTSHTASSTNVMIGGAENDIFISNFGPDTMTGGGGSDTFQLNNVNVKDVITDFIQGSTGTHDTIDLTALLGGINPGSSNISNYVSYNSTSGALNFYQAGDAAAHGTDFKTIATLDTNNNPNSHPATGTVTIAYQDHAHTVHTHTV